MHVLCALYGLLEKTALNSDQDTHFPTQYISLGSKLIATFYHRKSEYGLFCPRLFDWATITRKYFDKYR